MIVTKTEMTPIIWEQEQVGTCEAVSLILASYVTGDKSIN